MPVMPVCAVCWNQSCAVCCALRGLGLVGVHACMCLLRSTCCGACCACVWGSAVLCLSASPLSHSPMCPDLSRVPSPLGTPPVSSLYGGLSLCLCLCLSVSLPRVPAAFFLSIHLARLPPFACPGISSTALADPSDGAWRVDERPKLVHLGRGRHRTAHRGAARRTGRPPGHVRAPQYHVTRPHGQMRLPWSSL